MANDNTVPNAEEPYGKSKRLSASSALNYENVDFGGIRLPSVIGLRKATKAATAYASNIPNLVLAGNEAEGIVSIRDNRFHVTVPVPADLRIPTVWIDDVIEAFIVAHNDYKLIFKSYPVINLTGVSPTAERIIGELQKYRDVKAEYVPDPKIMAVVGKATPYMGGKIATDILGVKSTDFSTMIEKMAKMYNVNKR